MNSYYMWVGIPELRELAYDMIPAYDYPSPNSNEHLKEALSIPMIKFNIRLAIIERKILEVMSEGYRIGSAGYSIT